MSNQPFHPDRTDPASSILPITPGSALPAGNCRAILCGTAGTLNGTDLDGNVFTGLPLQQGYNPLSVSAVASGGTAANLWALY
jgi:hypothetical protein